MQVHRKAGYLLGALVAMLVAAAPVSAQEGTVAGLVRTDAGDPVAGAQVLVVGTNLGSLTQANGRFLIQSVPAGEREVQVELIGFGTEVQTVTVPVGGTVVADFILQSEAIGLQGIVVTGVAEATTRAKLPITVDQLTEEDLPVPSVSAASMIQGKVAGVQVVSGTGRPGSAPTILLRGPTSINSSGRNQEPLYIVDGVILSSSMVDIDALDIENIEVVKGAAAASLYGSRAGNGVVQITTKRGQHFRDDQVRYTVRSEFGQSQLPGRFNLAQNHSYATAVDPETGERLFVQENGQLCAYSECSNIADAGQRALQQFEENEAGQWVPVTDAEGNPVLRSANEWNTIQDQAWPGRTYDQVEEFFNPGGFMQNYFAAEGRSGATNYHVSYSNLSEEGVVPGQEGFNRHNFRLNLDQSVLEALTLSGSAFYSRSTQSAFPESQGNPIFRLTRMPAGANLRACVFTVRDEQGDIVYNDDGTPQTRVDASQNCTGERALSNMIIQPDPLRENDNPLYEVLNREYSVDRGRFLGSGNVRWRPIHWFNVDASVSYDRLDYGTENFYPKGYRDIRETNSLLTGNISRYNSLTEALNASITGTFRTTLGDFGTNRTQLRYLWEQEDWEFTSAGGYDFAVAGIPTLENVDQENVSASSGAQPVRSDGYFAITNFDLMERYIIDALVRNDGSSLFGPDERRQWYYRLAGAWRVTEEPWFNLAFLDELKLRYAIGTAGGRPRWSAQYETYNVGGGRISPVTLGNTELKPEFSTEQEFGVETYFLNNRANLTVNYATTNTEDQILQVPLAPYFGFSSQWRNAGTLESNTWEISLGAKLMETRNFSWSSRLLWDRTRQEITQLDIPAYKYGVGGQGLGTVFYAREGESLGTFYGTPVAKSCSDLPADAQEYCDQFAVNEDGFFVWVGDAGSPDAGFETWTDYDGVPQTWWGTNSAADTISGFTVAGAPVLWGSPITGVCEDRVTGEETTFCPVGNTTPDFNISLSNTLTWGGLSVYGLFDAVQGFDVFNQPLQWSVLDQYSGFIDQGDVPEGDQKPVGYYLQYYHGLGGLGPNEIFVQDGSFVKLRELSLRYRFGGPALAGLPLVNAFQGITLSAIGRNLYTWSDYDGYDPEVGRGGGNVGSAALARVDGYNYPNFRTVTVGLEVNF